MSADRLTPERRARLQLTEQIRARALQLGFDRVGFARVERFEEAERAFKQRIAAGMLDGLAWMTPERAEVACRPGDRLPWARSIVSLALNYYPGDHPATGPDEPCGRVARYAWGSDYHGELKQRLRTLTAEIAELTGAETRCAIYVDDSPFAEREGARRAGLGWFGKSTNLLVPGLGSWVLLAEVMTAAELEPDVPVRKQCGACTACVDACPTGAIVGDRVLDARRCISYLTIEHEGPIPLELRRPMGTWLFGCDICQEVCPVNRRAPVRAFVGVESGFPNGLADLHALLEMDEQRFRERFRGTPIFYAKRFRVQRNACVVLGNLGCHASVAVLRKALLDSDLALVRSHAAWALGEIGGLEAIAALQAAAECESDAEVLDEIGAALARLAVHGAAASASDNGSESFVARPTDTEGLATYDWSN